MTNKLLLKVFMILLFISCKDKAIDNLEYSNSNFNFEVKTGLSEDEFYEFINTVYKQRYPRINKLFVNPNFPHKIAFDSLAPPEIYASLSLKRNFYQLKKEKLIGFDLIKLDEYLKISRHHKEESYCETFEKEIGSGFALFTLPWYNSKDSTIVLRSEIIDCNSYCGGDMLLVYKKENGKWKKIR